MVDNHEEEPQVKQVDDAELLSAIKAAFPDLRCLRCRNDSFFLIGEAISTERILKRYKIGPIVFYPNQPKLAGLVCRRCGHVEQHAVDILLDSIKPISEVS